ncbi:putative NAD(P)-binding domain-containing protein [Seiridium unicorne]|uniref:NAD(P)-binding domain-containing protein n=1 Tax=Seiridium unicorne TaxID=138068 RepID=A0ABR2V392_9PEZI
MADGTILVLGGTGPAGICLLRELLYRHHPTIVYARNPSKIPRELASNPLLEVIEGDTNDRDALSPAIARCSVIPPLLGPQLSNTNIGPSLFADIYRSSVLSLMRRHGTRRIFAMGTITIQRPEDHWTLLRFIAVSFLRLFFGVMYQNIINLADAFDNNAKDLDWTVFRIAAIPGKSDEASWKKDRDDEDIFIGAIGEKGWMPSTNRSLLARWLADAAEGK